VVVAGIVVVALGGLADHGVAVIGRIEGAVPTPALPAVGCDDLLALLPGALAIAVIGYAETANDRAGANTQLVSLLVSGLTVLTAVALLPLFRDLPQATLGAIVISAVVGFVNVHALLLGVLGGLLLAVTISVLLLLGHQSRPGGSVLGRVLDTSAYVALENEPADRTDPGLLVFRLNAPPLFVNAKLVRDRLRTLLPTTEPPVRIVLLDLQFSAGLDVESLNMLVELHRELHEQGVALWLANVHTGVHRMLRRSGLADDIGEAHLYRTIADATPTCGPPCRPEAEAQASPLSPSPSSFTPMTRHSTAMMTALLWLIQSFRRPSSSADRSPMAKWMPTGVPTPRVPMTANTA
jgi:MFS superfamily sulfate permease-like transporter